MAIQFPGESNPPVKPDLESIESFDNTPVGGVEKFSGSGFTASSSFTFSRTGFASDYTSAGETIIGITSTASARTVTLSTAETVDGRVIIVKDESGAAGTNAITIVTEGAQLIDGAASLDINANYGAARLYSDGQNWYTW